MHASSHELALALAARLGEVVPAGVTLDAVRNSISVYADGELMVSSQAARILEEVDDRTLNKRVESAVLAVLSDVQDSVMRHLRSKWPTDGRGLLALPGARADQNRVLLWYGVSDDRPVISFRPIEFDEIRA